MRKITNILHFSIVSAVIIFSMAACAYNTDDDSLDGPTYFGKTLRIMNQQTWTLNMNAQRLSDVYNRYTGNSVVNAFIPEKSSDPYDLDHTIYVDTVGQGQIRNGILNITIRELTDSELLNWEELSEYYFHEWWLIDNKSKKLTCYPSDVKGNLVTLVLGNNMSSSNLLNRQKYNATSSSFTMETVYYVYVDKDCIINGESGMGTWYGEYFFITDPLNIRLTEGWNAICKITTYNQSGNAMISMSRKNPGDFRWAVYPNPYAP